MTSRPEALRIVRPERSLREGSEGTEEPAVHVFAKGRRGFLEKSPKSWNLAIVYKS